MSTRRRARQMAIAALAAMAALSLGACGEDDFTNDPARASATINVAARVDKREVVVSPNRFGAGLVNFTIANFSNSPVRFTLSGPKDTASQPIPPGALAAGQEPTAVNLEVELPEGSYEATAGQAASPQPATVKVGPTRPGSQNKLLEP